MKGRFTKRMSGRRCRAAYTLTEIMVASAIFSLVVLGSVGANLFGLKLYGITKAKLGASDEARKAISKLVNEVRSAKVVRVGNGSLSTFANIPVGQPQAGNALQIFPTTNSTPFIRYYWDSSDQRFKRTTDGAASSVVVANYISNQVVFRAEDHLGNVMTSGQNNRVIDLKLEFFQLEYPNVYIGPGGLFDYYKLETRITRRALE
jgi:prepilin-type N-terminal cleavage/methylation domain-containing protein